MLRCHPGLLLHHHSGHVTQKIKFSWQLRMVGSQIQAQLRILHHPNHPNFLACTSATYNMSTLVIGTEFACMPATTHAHSSAAIGSRKEDAQRTPPYPSEIKLEAQGVDSWCFGGISTEIDESSYGHCNFRLRLSLRNIRIQCRQ
ncbi:hypothetical protein PV04_00601 [Phialophora macrospora]|uniref:Uncharacterized protein n=1 Tax=Phialophora macrospora TaxID=1851006 RepID=A0A0D2GJ59_9EURO|nr:hypothetical protein PV04_00601 [Phialophora macrospora]